MTIPSEVNRSGPYTGNGVTTIFNYGFRIIDADHIMVILAQAGAETVLVAETDYIVSNVGEPGGGQVDLTVAPTADQTVTIIRDVPFTQETDLENQGPYFAQTIEDALDLSAMRDQQLQEQVNRSMKVPASASADELDELVGNVLFLVTISDNINTVANISSEIEAVSGIAADVTAAVSTVGTVLAAAEAVASDKEDVEDARDVTIAAASALGNQVRQYDTRAQAALASIPSGVSEIRITRFASGYPLAYATYIHGTSGGPMAFQDADDQWWELDLSGEEVLAAWFGVKADGTNDDAPAINAALVASGGRPVRLPSGVCELKSPIIYVTGTTVPYVAGPILRGAGMLVTTLRYSGSDTNIGIVTLTTGDTSGLKYTIGSEISDLTITQSNSNADVDGIRMTATWMPTFRRLRIENIKRHGIYVPHRPEINVNSDYYQDLYPSIEHCKINVCGGWAIYFGSGNGAGPFFIARNILGNCAGGGFYTEVGQGTFENNLIVSCGTYTGSPDSFGGMIVNTAPAEVGSPTPFGLRIIHNEFDTNEVQHLRIKAGINCLVDRNRFISNIVSAHMAPPTHIALGRIPDGVQATRTVLEYNAHRTPSGSALPVYFYEKEAGSQTEVREPLYIGYGSGAVKYYQLAYSAGDRVYEGGTQVLPE